MDSHQMSESIEKGEKRFSVADVLELVRMKKQKTSDDTYGVVVQPQSSVGINKLETMNSEKNKEPKHSCKMVEKLPFRYLFPPSPCGTKLVFMDNLNPAIKETDVFEFFKDVGKVESVKFMKVYNGILGSGHVRFETREAGRKALERNGKNLLDRPVELHAIEERSIYDTITPTSEHTYLYMGNLNPDITEEDIVEFFKDAGEVVFVRFICQGGYFLGHAHVEFASSTIAQKAFRYYGQKLRGDPVELVLATEESVWYSRTPSGKKYKGIEKPRHGMRRRGPGHGPTLGPFCCNCKLRISYGAGRCPGSCHM